MQTGQPEQIHLGWGEDPASSIVVFWTTASDINPCQVSYRPQGGSGWQQASGTSTKSPGSGYLHRVDLRDLQPGRQYEYRISADDGTLSPTYTTRTAGRGAFDYNFVYFTDTGLIGRLDGLATGTARVIEAIRGDNPLFLLGGGDYAYGNKDGRYTVMAEAGDEWFRQWQPVLAHYPIMPQFGNHEIELAERYEEWEPRFAYDKSHRQGRCYAFDVGDVHFTAFFAFESGKMPPPEDLAWLDADLAAARQKGTRWLIVFQHAPIHGNGVSHAATPEMRALLTPIYERHGVDLVLTGHDQSYERTYPLRHEGAEAFVLNTSRDYYAKGTGVIYAKISPAGKKSEIPRDFSRFTVAQQPFIAVRDDNAHHYAEVRIKASGRLEYIAYSIPDDASARTVLERFIIVDGSDKVPK